MNTAPDTTLVSGAVSRPDVFVLCMDTDRVARSGERTAGGSGRTPLCVSALPLWVGPVGCACDWSRPARSDRSCRRSWERLKVTRGQTLLEPSREPLRTTPRLGHSERAAGWTPVGPFPVGPFPVGPFSEISS